jgi:hypothetical protein
LISPGEAFIEELIRKTTCICPGCLREVPGRVVAREGSVLLCRACPACGQTDTLLSRQAWYHARLDRFFFGVMDERPAQRDFIIRLTERCNLSCPICLASANAHPGSDLPAGTLQEFARGAAKRLKIDLMAAEPTMREDLPDIIASLKKMGHIPALHTNGLKLADDAYLQTLLRAGLGEVHLQFDGFRDDTYQALRGQSLAEVKQKALANLERHGVATSLVMVISPGLNEDEIPAVFQYAVARPFVRELFFLGLRSLGAARQTGHEACYTPDDLIDIVEEKTGGRLARKDILPFQKLYFSALSLLGIQKCLYVQHYLLLRDNRGSFTTASQWLDWEKIDAHLDKLPGIPAENLWGRLTWLLQLGGMGLSLRAWQAAWDLAKMRIWSGFDLSATSGKTLVIGYITACDPYIYDSMVARYCGKGEVASDVGIHQSGADANIQRERYWKEKKGCQ